MKRYQYESLIILILIFITIFLNISPYLYRSFVTPEGKVFVGTQFYSDDYAVYVSYIRQGQQGRWTVIDKYTSEFHPSSFIHEEYLLWGKLTGLFRLPPVLAYHLSRALFGFIFLSLIYLLLFKIFPTSKESFLRIASFLLICFGGGFLNNEKKPFLSWLTEVDPTQRFGSLMHYLLGFIFLLGIFIWFLKNKQKNLLVPIILGLLTGFVLPTSLIMAITTLAIFGLLTSSPGRFFGFFESLRSNLKRGWTSLVLFGKISRLSCRQVGPRCGIMANFPLAIFVLIVAGIPAFIYYRFIFNVSPWSHILAFEFDNRGPFTFSQYLFALGPISFLAPLGLLVLKKKKDLVAFLVAWILAVLLWAFFLGSFFGLNPTRFLQNPVYIPLSIMTVLGVTQILKKRRLVFLVIGLLILIGLPTNIVSLKNHMQMYGDYSELIYPKKDLVEALNFLNRNTQPDETVLTLYHAGNLIPFLSGNTVYLGHLQETLDYPRKVRQAEIFYSGKLSDSEAREFLETNRIKLIFFGPQEKYFGGKIDKYSFLEPIFNNREVTIFRSE